jgi:hypothetical protein
MQFSELRTKLINGDWDTIKDQLDIKEYISIKQKHVITQQTPDNVIRIINGFAVLDRIESELNLYYLLCSLYTNIEFEKEKVIIDGETVEQLQDKFTDEEYDFLACNRLKDWLRKATKNDSYEFEQLFKNVTIDEIRRINSAPQFDIDGIKEILEEYKKIDPTTSQFLAELQTNQAMRKMAEESMKNESGS